MPKYKVIGPGDPIPWFRANIGGNPRYNFDTVGGRYVLIGFFGTLADAAAQKALGFVRDHRALFDDQRLVFFGVTADPKDDPDGRAAQQLPGIRYALDYDGAVSRLFGASPIDADLGQGAPYRRQWIVADPMLRVIAVVPFREGAAERDELAAIISGLPPLDQYNGVEMQAPVLMLRNVFEPELCERLIGLYDQHGGEESGFMREVDGKTVMKHDFYHKRRADYTIEDEELIKVLQNRVKRRIAPEILKAHQFNATRMERYIIGCYEAATSGHFRAHRDNTTKGTAHRKFAISINLNADFDGGRLSFPEFGPRSFKPEPGAAVVFSCSLLHAVSPVTRGKRYAFLPFLYDEEAARLREANNAYLGEGVGEYRASTPAQT